MRRSEMSGVTAKSLLVAMGLYCSLCATSATAVEVQQNQLYEGGTLIESGSLGLSFKVPDGWQGAWPAGSELFVLESQALKANIFVYIDQSGEQALMQQMAQPVPLDASVVLYPKSAPQKRNGRLTADYSIGNMPNMEGRISAVTGKGSTSVALIAVADQSTAAQVWKVAETVASSVKFSAPKPLAQGGGDGGWSTYMRGRHIVRYYTGSGYHEEEHIWLCSNGEFYRSGNSGGYGGGASGATGSQGSGRWEAQGSMNAQGRLILQYGPGYSMQGSTPGFDWNESGPGGERVTFTLALANNKLYLDGTQWLRDGNNRCQ
ncbi:hypothetical protein [Hahella sp. NBU794]|uniref:hypothetical protein n=1 Tax=Hahella sp. NBU794 TaxID=3422590 RepID=UPI003D6E0E11